ncbi:MAG: DNA repair protein RecN [Ignavibacteriae bacterium]|nr:DNA repair protein RecN [Ignavibacteriota bacterium]
MLKSIEIKDYALIENIFVEFESGLNIITGETGAGKSILIGALGLLLGERASSEVVRKGTKKTIVEGVFEISKTPEVIKYLTDYDIEQDEELIVRREISLKGSNRCFLNDSPVQLAVIKQIGNLLIDLHGQHDHQSLLKNETHIELFDEFCDVENELEKYIEEKKILSKIISEINTLRASEKSLKEKSDLYSFQLKEIDAVSPLENEDTLLEKDLNLLENSERIFSLSSQIHSGIYEDENPVYDLLVQIQNNLTELNRIDESTIEKLEEINSALESVKDVGDFIRDYRDKIEMDPQRIEEVRERVGAIHLLKKKYGGTLKNVLDLRNKIEEELNIAENFSEKIEELNIAASKSRKKLQKLALNLSEKRKKKATHIEKEIVNMLNYLGISDSSFKINFEMEISNSASDFYIDYENKKILLNNRGIDIIEFYISTNLGEDEKPLTKIASGGEISRVMLAIKSVMAKTEKLPLLIFDEIDTGVSGRIAQKVGKALKELSSSHQIISITHLPQIAAFADNHYSVQKQKSNKRIVSSILKLDNNNRVLEVAKLLSGEEITEAALASAKQLMQN